MKKQRVVRGIAVEQGPQRAFAPRSGTAEPHLNSRSASFIFIFSFIFTIIATTSTMLTTISSITSGSSRNSSTSTITTMVTGAAPLQVPSLNLMTAPSGKD